MKTSSEVGLKFTEVLGPLKGLRLLDVKQAIRSSCLADPVVISIGSRASVVITYCLLSWMQELVVGDANREQFRRPKLPGYHNKRLRQ